MPYEMKKQGSGYVVVSKDTGKAHSNQPMSKQKATAQMRALYANMKNEGK